MTTNLSQTQYGISVLKFKQHKYEHVIYNTLIKNS
jgi:hypothetical protein